MQVKGNVSQVNKNVLQVKESFSQVNGCRLQVNKDILQVKLYFPQEKTFSIKRPSTSKKSTAL
ncbi:hypothetical protein [Bacillus sp. JJ1764]|uniref:hypothetical protein n=1 Tax=Bacillus sp. JJ1764 TaxID=3122964 RepID=UPI003000A7C5